MVNLMDSIPRSCLVVFRAYSLICDFKEDGIYTKALFTPCVKYIHRR